MRPEGKLAAAAVGLMSLAMIGGALELAVRNGLISSFIVSPPSSLPKAFAGLWEEGSIVGPFLATLGQTTAATAFAAAVGIPFGFLLWRKPMLAEAYEAWLGAAFAAPTVLLYPLFLVIFGRGYATTIFVGFLASVIPVVLKTRDGLLGVPQVLIHVGRSFNMPERRLLWKIVFPAAAPGIVTGLRLGLIYAMVNIIGIEFLIDFGGLGRIVSDTYFRFQIPGMYAAIIMIVAVSLFLLTLLQRFESWLRPR